MIELKKKKDHQDPVNTLNERLFMLENLKSVDCALYFSSDESLEALVKSIKPDIMVVGSDWKGKSVIGFLLLSRIKIFDRIDEYSSTQIIQSIIDRR